MPTVVVPEPLVCSVLLSPAPPVLKEHVRLSVLILLMGSVFYTYWLIKYSF